MCTLPKPPAGRALSEGKEAPQAAFPSWCFPAQTKRRIQTHVSGVTSLNLPPDSLDAATMCSLYHIIYAEAEEERDAFVTDMARTIKKGGLLYLMDNSPVTGTTLPYHSNYIAKELVIGQLRHYGFSLVAEHHFLPQRYLLIFRNDREASHGK